MGRKVVTDMEGSAVKKGAAVRAAVFLVPVIIAAVIPIKDAQTYSEVVSVSCYKENPGVGNYVGDLTVPGPENACQGCNSMYSDCRGKCVGCVSDFDITEDVCYDTAGKKFMKPD
jgi:hypothetical protein